ncbi:MAG TPA: ABC transporter permease [Verrucomicrobiae bacterium]
MNALVKKEIRLLLPSFLMAVALTFGNWLFIDGPMEFNWVAGIAAFVACPAIAVFMALNSFGVEISAGTFSMLLAQPVSRQRIWRTKTWPLAAALFIGGFFWCANFYLHVAPFRNAKDFGDLWHLFFWVSLFLLAVYSGALWTVLLLRQVAAAFWFTLLVPGAIMVAITGLLGEKLVEPVMVVALLIYSLAGFFFARRLFLRAQDVAWTGGTIALPEMRGRSKTFTRATEKRFWRPRAALFWKELQLHQAQFIMAGVLALLHLGVLALRALGNYQKNSSMEFILEIFWGLWLVMPMLVGAAAVAEERKLGTLGSQFCLPVKRRTQFVIKFCVAILLSVLFGVVMPLLLEGSRILPNVHVLPSGFNNDSYYMMFMNTEQSFIWYCLQTLNFLTPLLALLGMATVIGAISFYASTLTRNTLQALAPAVLGLVLMTFLMLAINQPNSFGLHFPWRGWLIYFTGVPVFAITLVALSFANFKRVNLGGKVWLQNAGVFIAALAFIVVTTSVIYFRAWEKLTPFEPAHGAARLSLANPPALNDQWSSVSVRLADGKIWADDQSFYDMVNPLALFLGNMRLTSLVNGHFYDGSNWVRVLLTYRNERVGIKTDGTLWVSEKPARVERSAGGKWKMTKAGDLVRFGSETNWSSVVQHSLDMLLVKNDGTLWYWGVLTNWNFRKEWPGLKSFTPQRLGTESNWAEVFSSDNQPCLRKTDGSVWTTSVDEPSSQLTNEIAPGVIIQRAAQLEKDNWLSTTRIQMFKLGIRDDGTFRIRADHSLKRAFDHRPEYSYYDWTAVDLQFGHETHWLGVAGRGQKIVTLKNDGSLWLWNFYHDDRLGWDTERDERAMLAVKPVRLGTHADWIAITDAQGGIISLAADGSLWYWPLESAHDFASEFGGSPFWDNNSNRYFEPLLDISRKPQRLGNVFGKAD